MSTYFSWVSECIIITLWWYHTEFWNELLIHIGHGLKRACTNALCYYQYFTRLEILMDGGTRAISMAEDRVEYHVLHSRHSTKLVLICTFSRIVGFSIALFHVSNALVQGSFQNLLWVQIRVSLDLYQFSFNFPCETAAPVCTYCEF